MRWRPWPVSMVRSPGDASQRQGHGVRQPCWVGTDLYVSGRAHHAAQARRIRDQRARPPRSPDTPQPVDSKVLEQFPEVLEFKNRRSEKGEPVGTHDEPSSVNLAALSPTEAIERLISDADDAVAAELLDRVLAQPPVFLERLSLRLLRAMGYGGREAILTHTGRPGDAGLDGIIRQDALGIDLVRVQAKRYDRDSTAQRPEMQAFVGALQGAQTSRGVFVTTGRFSSGARKFADQVAMRLVLIDGTELTRLMVRYDVGVAVKETYQLESVDDDFFDDSK